MVTRAWKIYGRDGHRQRESFFNSRRYDCSKNGKTLIIEVDNADKTGTHEYSIMRITCDTAEDCEDAFWGQIGDGVFENSATGRTEEIEGEER